MDILFTLNNKYAPHLGALIVSILHSQPKNCDLNFHVISSDFSQDSQDKISSLKKIRNFRVTYYDTDQVNIDWNIFNIGIAHTSVETFYRLFAHDIIHDVDTILHLDIDTLVFSSLLPLWHIDIEGQYMAGVPCPSVDGYHLVPAGFKYRANKFIHAGVNVLNLKKMRTENISDRIFEVTKQYNKILRFQDQDIMNILFRDHIVELPLKYNAMTALFEDGDIISSLSKTRYREFLEAMEEPAIVHFTRDIKAWHKNSKNPYAKYYQEYLLQTPWAKKPLETISMRQNLSRNYWKVRGNVAQLPIVQKLRQLLSPWLDCYMKYCIQQTLKKNQKSGFEGYKPNMVLFSHIAQSDPLFFHFEKMLNCRFTNDPTCADAMVLWGTKFFYYRYEMLAAGRRAGLPLLMAEDGFIRSIDIAANGAAGMSSILDQTGIYYDVDLGCLFDADLNSDLKVTKSQQTEAQEAMAFICDHHISKYNLTAPTALCYNPEKKYESVILVIDQRKGDQSIAGAKADENSFRDMLKDAIEENPNSLILIKTHPDEISGGFEGYYSAYQSEEDRVQILHDNLNPISLMKAIDKLYVVSSQMGMEGLICGKDVYCYGAPFYSGWGLTTDRGYKRERKKPRSLEDVFYVTYIKNTFYYDPKTDSQGTIFDLLNHLNEEIQKLERS